MPCDTWEAIAGHRCNGCDGYATHFYGSYGPICCQCHGGHLVSQKDAKREHERVILEKDDEESKKIRQKELDSLDEMDIFGEKP